MKIENQVCARQQGKRFADLGIDPFASYFCYSGDEKDGYKVVPISSLEDDGDCGVGHSAPAFTVAELLIMQGDTITIAIDQLSKLASEAAEHLIYLLENGHITAAECNKRLLNA